MLLAIGGLSTRDTNLIEICIDSIMNMLSEYKVIKIEFAIMGNKIN